MIVPRDNIEVSVKDAVAGLEIELLKHEQAACPVYHHFSPGLYVREVNLPAGALAIGHYQKTAHLNIFLKGRVVMLNDDGSRSEISAPMIFTGQPGRKCGLVLEDVVWLNVYPTTETDVETLEKTYLDKSEGWSESKTEPPKRSVDIDDYEKLLNDLGVTEELVRSQSECQSDQIPFPDGSYRVAVFDSAIQGKGLFATADIVAGESIAPARIGEMRTPAGRYVNHSANPNAEMQASKNGIDLVAISDIAGCRGGNIGDEITVDYRKAIAVNRGLACQE
jgi:hypothetical protein